MLESLIVQAGRWEWKANLSRQLNLLDSNIPAIATCLSGRLHHREAHSTRRHKANRNVVDDENTNFESMVVRCHEEGGACL